ncbi:hypothetical protein P691DRAFT_782702 [Macrolepiota fuliginosa MF-IS2]|uniref:Uncharacterized protein n=1 Tax=Macrolepiota fuliginosa MF-IS2 TaxID=1400762 RepID=A0A9P5XLB2_9AGAR|nr:hypothetical protein P691DRAFT_782702 [Macrolepiota fuliginosa MF-IS2]
MLEQVRLDLERLTIGPGAREQPVSPIKTSAPSQNDACTSSNLESSETPRLRSCRSDGVLRGRMSVHKGALTIRSRSLERADGSAAATGSNLDKSAVATEASVSELVVGAGPVVYSVANVFRVLSKVLDHIIGSPLARVTKHEAWVAQHEAQIAQHKAWRAEMDAMLSDMKAILEARKDRKLTS